MKILRKNDIILFFTIAIASLALVFLLRAFLPQGTTAVISVDNKEIASYSIFEDKTINLDGNTVIINNGTVKMQSAECPLKICERHSAISKKGESIICLPHKCIVEIR